MTAAMAGTAMKPTKDARENSPDGIERPNGPAPQVESASSSAELEAFRKKLLRRAKKDPARPLEAPTASGKPILYSRDVPRVKPRSFRRRAIGEPVSLARLRKERG